MILFLHHKPHKTNKMNEKTNSRTKWHLNNRNRLTIAVIAFFFLAMAFGIVYFINHKNCPPSDIDNQTKADRLIANYQATLSPRQQEQYLGYFLDIAQIIEMSIIYDIVNEQLHNFRLYFGLSDDGETEYLIVKGIMADGSLYSGIEPPITQIGLAGLCPQLCDFNYPLSQHDYDTDIHNAVMPVVNPDESLNIESSILLLECYRSRKIVTEGGVKYIQVSIEQFDMIRNLSRKYDKIKGFGFFMASVGTCENENITDDEAIHILICPIDAERIIIPDWGILFTSTNFAGLCPRFCD